MEFNFAFWRREREFFQPRKKERFWRSRTDFQSENFFRLFLGRDGYLIFDLEKSVIDRSLGLGSRGRGGAGIRGVGDRNRS